MIPHICLCCFEQKINIRGLFVFSVILIKGLAVLWEIGVRRAAPGGAGLALGESARSSGRFKLGPKTFGFLSLSLWPEARWAFWGIRNKLRPEAKLGQKPFGFLTYIIVSNQRPYGVEGHAKTSGQRPNLVQKPRFLSYSLRPEVRWAGGGDTQLFFIKFIKSLTFQK